MLPLMTPVRHAIIYVVVVGVTELFAANHTWRPVAERTCKLPQGCRPFRYPFTRTGIKITVIFLSYLILATIADVIAAPSDQTAPARSFGSVFTNGLMFVVFLMYVCLDMYRGWREQGSEYYDGRYDDCTV